MFYKFGPLLVSMLCLILKRFLTHSTKFVFINCLLVCLVTGQDIRKDVRTHPNWKFLDVGENCGLSSKDRIIGGKVASLGQFPWLVRVGYSAVRKDSYQSEVTYSCGGSIITERYILTAAHCSPTFNFPDWLKIEMTQVRIGEHDARSDPDCQNGLCAPPVQDIDIEEYDCHPGYEVTNKHDDICVVRLAQLIRFGKYVHPICLPVYNWFQNKNFNGNIMEVAGWGVNDIDRGTTSDVLLHVPLPVVNQTHCQKQFQGHSMIIPKQLCAGGLVGQDSCTGDSGGPLMASLSVHGPPRYFLMGIVSYGDTDCGGLDKTPGIYTKITEYLIWILDHIKK